MGTEQGCNCDTGHACKDCQDKEEITIQELLARQASDREKAFKPLLEMIVSHLNGNGVGARIEDGEFAAIALTTSDWEASFDLISFYERASTRGTFPSQPEEKLEEPVIDEEILHDETVDLIDNVLVVTVEQQPASKASVTKKKKSNKKASKKAKPTKRKSGSK
jgi:hypothetical protein